MSVFIEGARNFGAKVLSFRREQKISDMEDWLPVLIDRACHKMHGEEALEIFFRYRDGALWTDFNEEEQEELENFLRYLGFVGSLAIIFGGRLAQGHHIKEIFINEKALSEEIFQESLRYFNWQCDMCKPINPVEFRLFAAAIRNTSPIGDAEGLSTNQKLNLTFWLEDAFRVGLWSKEDIDYYFNRTPKENNPI